jgi:hypothetical protein
MDNNFHPTEDRAKEEDGTSKPKNNGGIMTNIEACGAFKDCSASLKFQEEKPRVSSNHTIRSPMAAFPKDSFVDGSGWRWSGLFRRAGLKMNSVETLNLLLFLMIMSVAVELAWFTPNFVVIQGSSIPPPRGLHEIPATLSIGGTRHASAPFEALNSSIDALANKSLQSATSNDRYFSACMVTMDDNHFWKEFLAYHYTFLNLRRLIVAVDPRSKTSPTRIFDQWKDLINITQWSDEDFIFNCEKYEDDLTELHRCRQRRLYQKCSETLKKEQGTIWAAYIDVDEYIVPNWRASPYERIENYSSEMNIFDIFDANPHLNDHFKYSCFPMSRVAVNVRESFPEEVFKNVPAGINATSLMTLRYRNIEFKRQKLPGKSMMDLSRVKSIEVTDGNHNTHRPFKSQCDEEDIWISPWDSAFLTLHYPGTLEAFQFRDDPRKGDRRTVAHYYEKYNSTRGVVLDDSARFWISNFATKVGLQRARALLAGADQIGLEY